MKKSEQFTFLKDEARSQKVFGGALLKGRRKSIRPLTSKNSIHFVLRSTWAMGSDSFLARKNYRRIDQIITRFAKKFGVRIYQRAINSNHLHLLLRTTNRRLYRAFIKAIAGQIASHVMGQQSFLDFSRTRLKSVTGDGSGSSSGGGKSAEGSGSVGTNQIAKSDGNTITNKIATEAEGFWQFRPFLSFVNWGRDFKTCVRYLKQNILEAFGFVKYLPRKNTYAAWIMHSVPDSNSG